MRSERRKTITAVFTDLVESTSMAERLDPEALSAVLARYFAIARTTVEQHGGIVEKFIGDAVVAMFGIEQLREDDAVRAVRTAIDLRDAVERLNDELESAFGVRLRVRSGINTGEVVVATSSAESLAVGHAVSMAARLEQAAAPGEIVIGDQTYRLTRGEIGVTSLEPLAVKGSTVPLAAWRVDRLIATPARGWDRTGAYLGRVDELEMVAAAFERAVTSRRSGATLVVAPPGFGKTRFAAEVAARLAPSPRVVIGRAASDGGAAYGPIIDILRQLGAGEGAQLQDTLAALADGAQVARAAQALEAGSALATAADVAWITRRAATAVAADRPLLIVMDDLHWADPLLLDVVAELVEPPLPAPVFMLALTRPELPEERADWLASIADVPIVRLQPLTSADTARLVGERLGPGADLEQCRRIANAAAGVPLFVEQWAALDAESTAETVPSTIRALMAARIDRISGDARALLESAAIAGEAFTRGDVGDLASPEALDGALDALEGREIIRRDRTSSAFRFSHALLRDAVIDALPRRRRAELHERRAASLQAAEPVDLERTGHHLEAAWRERTAIGLPDADTTALAMRAAAVLAAVGARSLARKEWHRAVDFLRRATRLVPVGEPARTAILPDLIDALIHAGELDAADDAHDEAVRAARNALERARADTAWGRSHYMRRIDGWPKRIREILSISIPVFEAAADNTWLARAHILEFYPSTNAVTDLETLKRARIHAELAGDERSLIEVWDELGGAMAFGQTPFTEVLEFMGAEVAWARDRAVAFTEADGLLGEAYALAALGETRGARERIEAVRGLFEALPSVVEQVGEMGLVEAGLLRDAGDHAASAAAIERAVAVFESCGETGWARISRAWLAYAYLDLGRSFEAAELLDRIRPGRSSPAWFVALVVAGDARVALANGDVDRARELALTGSKLIEASTIHRNTISALEALGDVLIATGDTDAAHAQLDDARARAQAKEDRVAEARLRAKIGALPGN
jgi:class 3 adenylate cyclase/tetratricopeptide (TPR) repeat protein